MFPISDSIRPSRFPFFTTIIIVFTTFVFIQQIITSDPEGFIQQYALIPEQVNWNYLPSLLPFITAIFLHGGFLHIISNMWFLKVFGDNVEDTLTPIPFIILYFVSGVVGNLIQYMVMPTADIPMLGASGAVAGILGCYWVLFRHSKVKTLIFVFFFITIVEIGAPLLLGYWFILQLLSGATSLPSTGSEGGVAFFAHVGGFVVGIIAGYLFKSKSPQVLEYTDL